MRLLSLLVFMISFQAESQLLQAGVGASPANPAQCAKQNPQDDYEVPQVISSGSFLYSGRCINLQRFRAVAMDTEAPSDVVRFANYNHQNKYWKAEYSKTASIEAVYFHVVRFKAVEGVIAAHTQFRVKFTGADAVKLTDQGGSDSTETNTNDVVISFEASRPEGEPYNFAWGAVPNYVAVGRALSGTQRQSESTENETEQYKLNLSQQEAHALLQMALNKSSNDGYSRFYGTIQPNCTTDVFGLIDQVESVAAKNPETFYTEFSNNPVAKPSLEALRKRELFDESQSTNGRYSNLKEDLESGGASPFNEVVDEKALGSVFPEVPEFPSAMVMVEESEGSITEIKSMAYQVLPVFLQQMMSTTLLSSEAGVSALLSGLNSLSTQIQAQLQSAKQSGRTIQLHVYYTPWDGFGEDVDALEDLGVPARMSFETYSIARDEFSFTANLALGQASAILQETKPAFGVLGFVLHVDVSSTKSEVTLQVLGQLGPHSSPLSVDNEQVTIDTFDILTSPLYEKRALALITAKFQPEGAPSLKAEFGPVREDAELISQSTGLFQLADANSGSCFLETTPRLLGHAPKISAIGVTFNIYSVDFDVATQQVSTMDVRYTTDLLNITQGIVADCKVEADIQAQFTDNVNTQIQQTASGQAEKFVEQYAGSPGLSLIKEVLSNNKNQALLGFTNEQ